MSDLSNNQPLMIVIAILLPPLAVFLKKGAGSDLIIVRRHINWNS